MHRPRISWRCGGTQPAPASQGSSPGLWTAPKARRCARSCSWREGSEGSSRRSSRRRRLRLAQVGDRSIGQVAVGLNLTGTAPREWVRRAEVDAGKGPPGALTAFIAAREVAFPVDTMCRVLSVSRSGYYAWSKRGEGGRRAARCGDRRSAPTKLGHLWQPLRAPRAARSRCPRRQAAGRTAHARTRAPWPAKASFLLHDGLEARAAGKASLDAFVRSRLPAGSPWLLDAFDR
jgi:hypothetical protein